MQVPDYAMVQLLLFVEHNGNEVLTNIVMNYAVKSAEILLLKVRTLLTQA